MMSASPNTISSSSSTARWVPALSCNRLQNTDGSAQWEQRREAMARQQQLMAECEARAKVAAGMAPPPPSQIQGIVPPAAATPSSSVQVPQAMASTAPTHGDNDAYDRDRHNTSSTANVTTTITENSRSNKGIPNAYHVTSVAGDRSITTAATTSAELSQMTDRSPEAQKKSVADDGTAASPRRDTARADSAAPSALPRMGGGIGGGRGNIYNNYFSSPLPPTSFQRAGDTNSHKVSEPIQRCSASPYVVVPPPTAKDKATIAIAPSAAEYNPSNSYAAWRVATALEAGIEIPPPPPQQAIEETPTQNNEEEGYQAVAEDFGSGRFAFNRAAPLHDSDEGGGDAAADDSRCVRTETRPPMPMPTTDSAAQAVTAASNAQQNKSHGGLMSEIDALLASYASAQLATTTGGGGGYSALMPSSTPYQHAGSTISAVMHLLFAAADEEGKGQIPLDTVAKALRQVPYHLDKLNTQVEALNTYLSVPATAPRAVRSAALIKANSILNSRGRGTASNNNNNNVSSASFASSRQPVRSVSSSRFQRGDGAENNNTNTNNNNASYLEGSRTYVSEYGSFASPTSTSTRGANDCDKVFASFVGGVGAVGEKYYESGIIHDPYADWADTTKGNAKANLPPPPASILMGPRHPGTDPSKNTTFATAKERWEALYRPKPSQVRGGGSATAVSPAGVPADDGGSAGSPYHRRILAEREAARRGERYYDSTAASGKGGERGDALSFDCSDYIPHPTPTPSSGTYYYHPSDAASQRPRIAQMMVNTNALFQPVTIEEMAAGKGGGEGSMTLPFSPHSFHKSQSAAIALNTSGGALSPRALSSSSVGGGGGGGAVNPFSNAGKTPKRVADGNLLLIPLAEGVHSFADEREGRAEDRALGLVHINDTNMTFAGAGPAADDSFQLTRSVLNAGSGSGEGDNINVLNIGGATAHYERAKKRQQLLLQQVAFLNEVLRLVVSADEAAEEARAARGIGAVCLSDALNATTSTVMGGADGGGDGQIVPYQQQQQPQQGGGRPQPHPSALPPPPPPPDAVTRLVRAAFKKDAELQHEMRESIDQHAERMRAIAEGRYDALGLGDDDEKGGWAGEKGRHNTTTPRRVGGGGGTLNHTIVHNHPITGEPSQEHRHAALFASIPHGVDVADPRAQPAGIIAPSPASKVTRRIPGASVPFSNNDVPQTPKRGGGGGPPYHGMVASPLPVSSAAATHRPPTPSAASPAAAAAVVSGGGGLMRRLPSIAEVEQQQQHSCCHNNNNSSIRTQQQPPAIAAPSHVDYRTFCRVVEGIIFGKYDDADLADGGSGGGTMIDAASLAHMSSFKY